MESHSKPFSHGRRLFELLEEQQEPFLLEVYLSENGYSCKLLKSQGSVKCWPTETCGKLLGFSSHGFTRRRGGRVLSCVLPKLVHWKLIRKALNLDNGRRCFLSCFTTMGSEARASRFSRLLHSCEEVLDGRRHWKTMEDSKPLSPVSVFELQSDEACSANNHSVEEESPSTSTLNLELSQEPRYSSWFSNVHQYKNGKKDFLRSKQLLLQCSKELEEKIWCPNESLSLNKAGNAMEMQIFSLEKHRRDVARIAKLIDVDLSGTRRELNHFQAEAREIGLEIERFIFEEINEDAIVEMLGSHCLLERVSF